MHQLLQSHSFAIDEYQREYRWEKKNVDELLSDLQTKFFSHCRAGADTRAVSNYGEYFLGSIIVRTRNGKNYLIDGSPRVTSMGVRAETLLGTSRGLEIQRPTRLQVDASWTLTA